jgi:hypothetical protein
MSTKLASAFHWNRRGNALVATLIISATVGLAINLSSERLQGLQVAAQVDHAKLEARLAAESLAAIIEGRLRERGAEDTAFLTKSITSTEVGTYGSSLEIAGFANSTDTRTRGIRIGNCMVWWRVEPVKVWSETVKQLSEGTDGLYAINPNMDDQNASLDLRYKEAVAGDTSLLKDNDRNFLFRIVTEAYSLTDPTYVYNESQPDYNPRTKPELRKASAQATRVVQYTLVNLFEYAIFYAAEGATGDLEFWQGTGMAVKGRVHSNGAIYIGGGGQAYMSNQFHSAASGNGGLSIGGPSAAEQTMVTAVDGIYRMRKPANYVSVIKGMHPSAYVDPYKVPTVGLGGELNLNGDTPTDNRHTINGKPFTSANDSRSTAIDNRMLTDFGRRVSDRYTGTKVVQSLANVPKFKGRPLEPELLGGTSDRLYGDPTLPVVTANLSLNQAHAKFAGRGAPLYYASNPRLKQAPAFTYIPASSFTPSNPDASLVTAYNLPLYRQDDKMEKKLDVTDPGTLVELAQDTVLDTPAGFRTGTRTILLHNQLQIDPKTNTTGLVIRERAVGAFPNHPFPTVGGFPDSPTAAQLAAMATYLKAQYQVRFYGQDITDAFFNDLTNPAIDNLAACTTKAQAIVTEDLFINRRESNFMNLFFGQNQDNYRVNLITLNLRRIQEFIAYTPMKTLHGNLAANADVAEHLAKKHFNGVVYVHRTRRSQTYDPLVSPYWLFNTTVRSDFNPPTQLALDGLIAGGVRELNGPVETFHAAVRVRGGLVADGDKRDHMASVNWQHDTNNDGLPEALPLGTSKMTIITPNPMYLWGDINTTPYSDGTKNQRVPVAVFADSMTLLSAAWNDANVDSYNPSRARPYATHTSYVTSFVINNLPCREWNAVSEGSGAVANVCRFLEDWGGGGNPTGDWPMPLKNMAEHPLGMPRPSTYGGQVVFTFMGSLVVMNEQRYGRGVLGAGNTNLNNTSFYSPPFRNLAYNTDLKLAAGQPPEALRALETTRVISSVNMFDN